MLIINESEDRLIIFLLWYNIDVYIISLELSMFSYKKYIDK